MPSYQQYGGAIDERAGAEPSLCVSKYPAIQKNRPKIGRFISYVFFTNIVTRRLKKSTLFPNKLHFSVKKWYNKYNEKVCKTLNDKGLADLDQFFFIAKKSERSGQAWQDHM